MSEELKPCPFCGNKVVYKRQFSESLFGAIWNWNVKCFNCIAEGPICDTEQEAISAWNRRS